MSIIVVAPYPSVIWNIAQDYGLIWEESGRNVIMLNSRQGLLRIKCLMWLLLNSNKGDVINVHSSGYFDDLSLLYAIFVSKLKGQKVILSYHCGDLANVLHKTGKLLRPLLNRVNKITTVSIFMRDELLKFEPSLENKIIAIQNFLKSDPDGWIDLNAKSDITILTVGAISKHYIKRKGLKTFVNAASYLPNLNFVIVGKHVDGSVWALKSIASDNVTFTGYLSNEELINWYRKAAIYCQLSSSEGLPIALLESMSFGCIPVVTNTTSHPEVVGDCGYLVPYNNTEATVAAITTAIDASHKRICSIERINTYFSLNETKKELIKNLVLEI